MKKWLWIALAVMGCKETVVPEAPELELVSVSPTTMVAHAEPVEVVLHYRDAQGDLGTEDADDYTLWMRDARLDADDGFHVPPMTPADPNGGYLELSIEGNLVVQVPPLFVLGGGEVETTQLTFTLEDRAGNRSASVVTGVLTVQDTVQ
jgi:hypothetical protein